MAKLITVFWRDIPSQVMVRKGRQTVRLRLAQRFQDAIDRAAMRAGKGSSDAYLSEWRRETVTCSDDDRDQMAAQTVERLEAAFTDENLLALIRAKGSAGAKTPQAD
ncbi:MAG: virulence factor [Arenicellales bacterium]|jgi:hypothetical protein